MLTTIVKIHQVVVVDILVRISGGLTDRLLDWHCRPYSRGANMAKTSTESSGGNG